MFNAKAFIILAQVVIPGFPPALPEGPDGNTQCVVIIDRRHNPPCYDAAKGITSTPLDWEKGLRAQGMDVYGNPVGARVQ